MRAFLHGALLLELAACQLARWPTSFATSVPGSAAGPDGAAPTGPGARVPTAEEAAASFPPLGRVVIGEFFQDVIPWDAPECNHTPSPARVPWLSPADLRARRMPTLAELGRSALSIDFLFRESARRCPGAPDLVDPQGAPPAFCVHPPYPIDRASHVFDMYQHERLMLARWLQEASVVGPEEGWGQCGAGVVVLPSLVLHYYATHGLDWTYEECLQNDVAAAYWRAARAAFVEPCRALGRRPPVLVVNHPFSWDNPGTVSLLRQLALQPGDLASRVVISTTMSNLPRGLHRAFGKKWKDGAEDELSRREALLRAHAARDPSQPAKPLTFAGPLLVSVARSTGIAQPVDWLAPAGPYRPGRRDIDVLFSASLSRRGHYALRGKQVIRPVIAEAMARAGAACGPKGCSLCSAGRPACANRTWVYDQTAHAAVCLEPPGDVLGRSHLYVAVLSGCVPAIVDGGHLAYAQRAPTWWAWRAGRSRQNGTAVPATALDYRKFAFVLRAEDLDPGGAWLARLRAAASDEGGMRRKREALARVQPLFAYARRACGVRCDAFSMFQLVLRRAKATIAALP